MVVIRRLGTPQGVHAHAARTLSWRNDAPTHPERVGQPLRAFGPAKLLNSFCVIDESGARKAAL